MTNSEQALRDFAEKQFPLSKELKKEVLYNQVQQAKQNECLSDLTALISEHYYPKEKYNELLQQRDELKELYDWLKEETADGLSTFEMPHDFADVLRSRLAAIKNTEQK